MLLVFLFHCARFFGGGGWHLKNPGAENLIATLFIGILDLWLMPLFFLLSGAGSWYALASRTGGQYLFERVKRILIPLYGVGACILLLPQAYFEAVTNGGYTGTFWEGLPLYATMSIASWSWVAFMLSLGAKYLNIKNKLVTYGNEAVLPFYIFHQTIILCVGWFVLRWNMGILSKYLIIAVFSFILIIVLYEMLVRPFNVVRFLFGMRSKKTPAGQPA